MNTRLLVFRYFSVLVLILWAIVSASFAQQPPSHDPRKDGAYVVRPHLVGQTGAKAKLPGDGNLPEAASALPLLSAIGAGALLGGLLSARRTRR